MPMVARVRVLLIGAILVVAGLLVPTTAASAAVATPRVSLGPDAIVGEKAGFVDVRVTLSDIGTRPVSMYYNTSNGTAIAGADYSCPLIGCVTGTLTFAPGEVAKTIRVPITNDTAKEALESFAVNVYSSVNATIARSYTRVSIADNDTVVGTPALYVRDATIDETAGTVDVPVIMGGPAGAASARTVTVHYATSNATATSGADYTAATGTLTFAPGQTAQNIPIKITNDTTAENAETFTVTLSAPTNASLGDPTATATIGANDATPVTTPRVSIGPDAVVGEADGYLDVPIRLSAPGTSPVSFYLNTGNGTAIGGTDYSCPVPGCGAPTIVFEPGQTLRTVRIDIANDTAKEALESFAVTVYSSVNATIARATATISISDND